MLANKKFILVTACTSPFPISHFSREIPQTLCIMKMHVKKLKGKVVAKLVYTDTLFKFLANKEKGLWIKLIRIGKGL